MKKKFKQKIRSKSTQNNDHEEIRIRVSKNLIVPKKKSSVQIDYDEKIINKFGCNFLEVSRNRSIKQVVFEPTSEPHVVSKSTLFIANVMIKSPFKGLKRIGHDLIDF